MGRPKNVGLIISGRFCWRLVNDLSGGRLRTFFEPYCGLEVLSDYSEDDLSDLRAQNEDLLNHSLACLFGPTAFELLKHVPLDQRYSVESTGVAVGLFSAVFLVIDGVLRGDRRLVLAIAPNRDAARCAEDVMENGFTFCMNWHADAHWDGFRLKALARKCFDSLKCKRVYAHANALPWEMTSERAKAWHAQSWRPHTWKNGADVLPKRESQEEEDARRRVVPKRFRHCPEVGNEQ